MERTQFGADGRTDIQDKKNITIYVYNNHWYLKIGPGSLNRLQKNTHEIRGSHPRVFFKDLYQRKSLKKTREYNHRISCVFYGVFKRRGANTLGP